MNTFETFDNGHGWRIAFDFQGERRVLTLPETAALIALLTRALDEAITKGVQGERG